MLSMLGLRPCPRPGIPSPRHLSLLRFPLIRAWAL
jgi:hypothetical protein